MPENLCTKVHDVVHEAMIKTISKKKKCKTAKWLSEEGEQIAERRREAKGKGEKERYTHLNTEFQRIARSDKKAFLNDQCKEVEENNRMGKARDLFTKIRDTKGAFHGKMGTIKDKNGMDLIEAENTKRWKDTQKNYTKKVFSSVQFSPVAQLCPTLCDPMNCSTPGLPVHHQLREFTQTHVQPVSDAIQPSHPLSSPSPPTWNPSQHQSFPISQLFI